MSRCSAPARTRRAALAAPLPPQDQEGTSAYLKHDLREGRLPARPFVSRFTVSNRERPQFTFRCVCGSVRAAARLVLAEQKRRSVPKDNGSCLPSVQQTNVHVVHQIRLFHLPKHDNMADMLHLQTARLDREERPEFTVPCPTVSSRSGPKFCQ